MKTADAAHLNRTWRDMPGDGEMVKRMNFSLFRRGKISVEYVNASNPERAKMNGFHTSNSLHHHVVR